MKNEFAELAQMIRERKNRVKRAGTERDERKLRAALTNSLDLISDLELLIEHYHEKYN